MKKQQKPRITKTATFSAQPELMAKARQAAKKRFQTMSSYICALIVRDLEEKKAA